MATGASEKAAPAEEGKSAEQTFWRRVSKALLFWRRIPKPLLNHLRSLRPHRDRRRRGEDGGARGGNVRTLRSKRLGQACEGADQIRTGVRGFAGLCLTSRPRRREGHRSPRFRGRPAGYCESMARSKLDELRKQAARS